MLTNVFLNVPIQFYALSSAQNRYWSINMSLLEKNHVCRYRSTSVIIVNVSVALCKKHYRLLIKQQTPFHSSMMSKSQQIAQLDLIRTESSAGIIVFLIKTDPFIAPVLNTISTSGLFLAFSVPISFSY